MKAPVTVTEEPEDLTPVILAVLTTLQDSFSSWLFALEINPENFVSLFLAPDKNGSESNLLQYESFKRGFCEQGSVHPGSLVFTPRQGIGTLARTLFVRAHGERQHVQKHPGFYHNMEVLRSFSTDGDVQIYPIPEKSENPYFFQITLEEQKTISAVLTKAFSFSPVRLSFEIGSERCSVSMRNEDVGIVVDKSDHEDKSLTKALSTAMMLFEVENQNHERATDTV